MPTIRDPRKLFNILLNLMLLTVGCLLIPATRESQAYILMISLFNTLIRYQCQTPDVIPEMNINLRQWSRAYIVMSHLLVLFMSLTTHHYTISALMPLSLVTMLSLDEHWNPSRPASTEAEPVQNQT